MAEKTLNVTIQSRYDTLQNWTTRNPVLAAGEIAVVAIPTNSETTVGQVVRPAIVFKVGDGTTAFNSLPYASGLAADVYAWAKASTKPTYTAEEIGAATSTDISSAISSAINNLDSDDTAVSGQYVSSVSETNGIISVTRASLPTYTLQTGETAGTFALYKDNVKVGDDVEINGWDGLLSSISAKYTKPANGIPLTDLTSGVQTSLRKADSAVQSVVSGTQNGTIAVDGEDVEVTGLGSAAFTESSAYATAAQGSLAASALQSSDITTGTANGTISVDGTNVAVRGLGSAAYTAATAYATSAQGDLADSAVQPGDLGDLAVKDTISNADVASNAEIAQSKISGLTSSLSSKASLSGAAFTGAVTVQAPTAATNPATKKYVDDAINGVTQIDFQVVESYADLPEPGEKGTIYLVPQTQSSSENDIYDEYIYITDRYEHIGSTSVDLSDYATNAAVTSAINGALDSLFSITGDFTASRTITSFSYSAANNRLTVTTSPIAITASQVTDAGALATKDTISNADVASNAAIAQSKISGLTTALNNKANASDLTTLTSRVTTAEGDITTLEGDVADIIDGATPVAQATNATTATRATQDGNGNVITSTYVTNTALTNKINSLDKADSAVSNQYVTAVSETNGIVTVSRKQVQWSEIAGKPTTTYAAGTGLAVSGTSGGTVTYNIDDNTVFIFDCGTATTNIS